MIPKSTNSELVDEMIGIDLIELINLNVQNPARKWDEMYHRRDPKLIKRSESKDYLKGTAPHPPKKQKMSQGIFLTFLNN